MHNYNLGAEFTKKIFDSLPNFYLDNHDYYRFGKAKYEKSLVARLKYAVAEFFSKHGFIYWKTSNKNRVAKFKKLYEYYDQIEDLYRSLADETSRSLLVDLLTYYILGKHKVKLPLSNPAYWMKLTEVETLADQANYLTVKNWDRSFYLFDLNAIGYSVKLYFTAKGILNDFVLKQYEYAVTSEVVIRAEPGETVIDAGGCYGDTALYFAERVGSAGKVFVFEFIPSNIAIANKNFELNSSLSPSIELITNPVWEKPGVPVYYIDKGPGSKVTFEETFEGTKVLTESIDNLVETRNIHKVDFIKMDIEGAEVQALKGALKTMKKYKPKLAISVYHSISDLGEVPAIIKSIDPAYQLYLGHYTIHSEETILFATLEKK